jgi:hypothetical protein
MCKTGPTLYRPDRLAGLNEEQYRSPIQLHPMVFTAMSTSSSTALGRAALATSPEEILIPIVRQVPHDSLPALARVSSTFYRLATSQLYRSVHFLHPELSDKEDPWYRAEYPIWSSTSKQCIGTRFEVPSHQGSGRIADQTDIHGYGSDWIGLGNI